MYDDPKTLGWKHIAVRERINSTYYLSNKGDIAGDAFMVYKRIQSHIVTPIPHDPFFISISGVTTQKINNKSNRITRNNIEAGSYWHWDHVR
jgi:hypothetical protein